MTRKDYVAIAAALLKVRDSNSGSSPDGHFEAGWETAHYFSVLTVADTLAADNPRFDRGRFYAAAGI